MSRAWACGLASALLLLASVPGPAPAQETPRAEPEDMGIEERLRIDYVLIDFIVLDENGQPVPDVTLEQLRLKVAGHKVEIETLDRNCAQEPGAEPQAAEPGTAPPSSAAAAPPPRIVLVFDYDHMTKNPEVFDRAQDMMAESAAGGEPHMIVSFAEVVRLETPFTADIDELRWALRRMRNDRDLYAKQRAPLTEQEFFDRLRSVFDLLGRYPGRKTVVLFSGPFIGDGFTYDERYHDVAGLAAAARTAIYPVDAAGLRTADLGLDSRGRRRSLDSRGGGVGGPPELSRLANETGGRMTANTNDIGQAYEQARGDLSCTYTLGFRDPKLELDRDLNLLLKIEGRGNLRLVYPDRYIVRSEEARRESLVRTAGLAPHAFESPDVGVDLFVTGAKGGSWKGVIAAELQLPPEAVAAEGESWKLESFLRKPNGTIVHRFSRSVALPKPEPGELVVARTFEELEPEPGDYALSVVLADPRGQPRAATRSIHIPELPQSGPFLLGPILGHGEGSSFSPLVEQAARAGAPLDALTVFCIAGGNADVRSRVARRLVDEAERDVHRLDEASGQIQGGGVRCQKVLDTLETKSLAPGRYEIRARGEAGEWVTEESGTQFEIEAEESAPAPDRP